MQQSEAYERSSPAPQEMQWKTLLFHLPGPTKRKNILPKLYSQDDNKEIVPIRTLLKYCVDCTQRSSISPLSPNRGVRSNEHMSNLPITLKLGLCKSRSNCKGVKVNGYGTPVFRPGFLSNTFTKLTLDPPQQITVASSEMALNGRDIKSMLPFVGETSLPQMHNVHAQKLFALPKTSTQCPTMRSTAISIEYATSRAVIADTCFTNSTNR